MKQLSVFCFQLIGYHPYLVPKETWLFFFSETLIDQLITSISVPFFMSSGNSFIIKTQNNVV